jgi:hypothetical protein
MIERKRQWWDRTFSERQRLLERTFGCSQPPGAPRGNVLPLQWDRMEIPGACCLVIPPTPTNESVRFPHEDWMYLTLGLTQPVDPEHLRVLREATSPTSYESEFALLTREAADWAPSLLQQVMWYVRARRPLNPGDRLPMRFERTSDGSGIEAILGDTSEPDCRPVGPMRAILVWPMLADRRRLRTSIGGFRVMGLVTITQPEWDYARTVGAAPLQRLLMRAGFGARSEAERRCVVSTATQQELEDACGSPPDAVV